MSFAVQNQVLFANKSLTIQASPSTSKHVKSKEFV